MKQINQLSRHLGALAMAAAVSLTAHAKETRPNPPNDDKGNPPSRETKPGRVDVTKNHPPEVKITQPRNGDSFKASNDIQIDVVANDRDGWTSQATFYANDRVLGEQTLTFVREPDNGEDQHYSFVWNNVPEGKYKLHAEVIDDAGNKGESRPVVIHVRDRNNNGGNDPLLPIIQVETSDGKASETGPNDESNPGSFRIWREGDLAHPLEVFYHMRGKATNGLDYQLLPGSATIPEGENSVEIPIQPIDDDLSEGTEQVVLILDDVACIAIFPPSPDCYQVGRKDAARLNIFDNDRDRNHAPKAVMISPRNHQRFQAPASISLAAEAIDKDGWIGAFQFIANDRVLHEGTINFIVAPEPGQRQHFEFLWEDVPVGSYEVVIQVTDNEGTSNTSRPIKVEVIGETDLPEVSVFARDALASETTGNENIRPNKATFRFRRTGKTDEPLTVQYQIAGTAENGVDYERLEGSVVIEAKKRWGTVDILPIADDLDEGRETVILTLEAIDDLYSIGREESAKALITDNTPDRKGSKILKDGSIHIRLPAVPGEEFLLEVSENLEDWEVIDTGVSEEDAFDIIANRPGLRKGQYFRIRKAMEALAEEE